MSFLPNDYEVPSDNNYLKLKNGPTRIRILTPPIIGYLSWVDGAPVRTQLKADCPPPSDPKQKIKHFWAMVVYNVDTRRIQILEITQQSIQLPIQNLSQDADWGNPMEYGLTITKEGEGFDTSYLVTPAPPKPVPQDVMDMFAANPVRLEALYEGGDPFEQAPPAQATTHTTAAAPAHHAYNAPPPREQGDPGSVEDF